MKIAVVVRSSTVPAWQAWTIDALRSLSAADVRVVALNTAPWSAARKLLALLGGAALAPCSVQLNDNDVGDAALVVDLSGSNGAFKGQLATWSLRLGEADDQSLPFAYEIAAGARTFTITLVSCVGERTEQLRRGVFPITAWYPSTVRIALGHAATWAAVFAAALLQGVPIDAVAEEPAVLRKIGHGAPLRFASALAARLAASLMDRLFEVVEWNVGFARGDARTLLAGDPLDVHWLPPPPAMTFVADPFVIERDGMRVLFAEQFDYRRGRGVIAAHVLTDDTHIARREPVLDFSTHLSYPYPIEIDGELYLVPENCAANEVAMYRCVEFPWRWERASVMLPEFDGVDTTVFAHGGRWWAFATRYSRGSTLALYAFHAESPRGPWRAHALNPIIVDVATARPAGQPFVVDSVLYRPAQDCSTSYGAAVVIARVDELSPASYRETIVRRIDGHEFAGWSGGVHTVSFTRDAIVIDAKRSYRDVRKLFCAPRWIRSRLRRLRASGVMRCTNARAM